MCDSKDSVKSIEINKFYGRKRIKHLDIKNLRRKQNLIKVEKYVASRKAADALSLRMYDHKTDLCEPKSNILTSHPKDYAVFAKQDEAIKFSHDKVNPYNSISIRLQARAKLSRPH